MITESILEDRIATAKELHVTRNARFDSLAKHYLSKNSIEVESEEDYMLPLAQSFRISNVYQSKLARLPAVRCFPTASSEKGLKDAARRERAIYGLWWANKFVIKHIYLNWYASVLGQALIRFGWDYVLNMPRISVGIPAYYFPGKINALGEIPYEVYAYTLTSSEAKDLCKRNNISATLPSDPDEAVDVEDYQDKEVQIQRVNGKITYGVEHNNGFTGNIPIQNLPLPESVEGVSDIELITKLAAYEDYLFSELATGLDWWVKAPLVYKGSGKTPDIKRGEVTQIESDESLEPLRGGQPPELVERMIARSEINIDKTMGIGVTESQSPGSIVTGPGIEALRKPMQGHVDMRRILREQAYAEMNECLLSLIKKKSPDKEVDLFGTHKGKEFSLAIKGSEISDVRNQVYWTVASLQEWHQNLVAMLQLRGQGGIARYDMLETLEYEDVEAMLKRVREEKIEDAKLEAEIIKIRSEATATAEQPPGGQTLRPEQGSEEVPPEMARLAMEKGQTPKEKKPVGRPGGLKKLKRLYKGEVLGKLKRVQRLKGRIFLMGGLVTDGFTDRDIDLMLTDLIDKQTILNALPEYRGRIDFVQGTEPEGDYVEVMTNAVSDEATYSGEEKEQKKENVRI